MLRFRELIGRVHALRELCTLVCVHRATQGVFVEPADLWRAAWALRSAARTDVEIEQVTKDLRDALGGAHPDRSRAVLKTAAVPYPFASDPDFDLEWYPPWLASIIGSQHPLTVHIHVCQRHLSKLEFDRQRRDLQGISRRFLRHFSVVVEERSPAILGAVPGSPACGTLEGTLGGYLSDAHGNVFGVTCAHVAPLGSSVTDARGALLGNVVHDSTLLPSDTGQLCTMASPSLNTMDASLFAATSTRFHSRCGAPLARYGAGQTVQMTSANNKGPNTYYVAGVGLIQTLVHDGRDYCFTGLTRITSRPTLPVPDDPAKSAASPSPVAGDSGAWIHASVEGATQKPGWIGMLVGTDQLDGYAVDANEVIGWASAATGTTLSVW